MADEVKLGRPTDYRPEFDERIIELAKKEWSMYEIAAEFEVSHVTMWRWTESVESFCKAYARAKTIQTAAIMRGMRRNVDNKNYNDRIAQLRLRHEAGLIDAQKVNIKGISKGTLNDKTQKVFEEAEKGEMVADDMLKITNAIAVAAKIDEVTDLRDKVEKLEELQGK